MQKNNVQGVLNGMLTVTDQQEAETNGPPAGANLVPSNDELPSDSEKETVSVFLTLFIFLCILILMRVNWVFQSFPDRALRKAT